MPHTWINYSLHSHSQGIIQKLLLFPATQVYGVPFMKEVRTVGTSPPRRRNPNKVWGLQSAEMKIDRKFSRLSCSVSGVHHFLRDVFVSVDVRCSTLSTSYVCHIDSWWIMMFDRVLVWSLGFGHEHIYVHLKCRSVVCSSTKTSEFVHQKFSSFMSHSLRVMWPVYCTNSKRPRGLWFLCRGLLAFIGPGLEQIWVSQC